MKEVPGEEKYVLNYRTHCRELLDFATACLVLAPRAQTPPERSDLLPRGIA